MKKRYIDAVAIVDPGACNPSGIAHAIIEACEEMRAEGNSDTSAICNDAAVRLMVHQLAHLTRVFRLDHSLTDYGQALDYCRDMAKRENAPAFFQSQAD